MLTLSLYISKKRIDDVIKTLEDESTKLYQWYTFNYLKPNADKYRLLLSSQDKELHLTIENEKIKNSNQEKLRGITIDNNSSCIPHVRKICRQASKKLHALARICTFMTQNKRKIIMKAFIESQFNYCPLVWMFHGNRGLNDAMNKIHERGSQTSIFKYKFHLRRAS